MRHTTFSVSQLCDRDILAKRMDVILALNSEALSEGRFIKLDSSSRYVDGVVFLSRFYLAPGVTEFRTKKLPWTPCFPCIKFAVNQTPALHPLLLSLNWAFWLVKVLLVISGRVPDVPPLLLVTSSRQLRGRKYIRVLNPFRG